MIEESDNDIVNGKLVLLRIDGGENELRQASRRPDHRSGGSLLS